jgi:hypothetical protein
MFNCNELAEYLNTPIKKRTKQQRGIAYAASYNMLINWWKECLVRNHETPTLSYGSKECNIPNIITELEQKRDSFLN